MRQLIESTVQIFRSHPDAEADEILNLIIGSGVERRMAIQLVLLLPLAYGRVLLSDSGVVFTNTYLCLGNPGKGRLDALPLWAEALDFAKHDAEPPRSIASRSPEVRAANEALLDGRKLENMVWSPPAFLWSIEPVPELHGMFKKPSWWRRIWDDPADYSVTRGERTLTRIAMIIGIAVGLLAVGVVAYYGISLLRELH